MASEGGLERGNLVVTKRAELKVGLSCSIGSIDVLLHTHHHIYHQDDVAGKNLKGTLA